MKSTKYNKQFITSFIIGLIFPAIGFGFCMAGLSNMGFAFFFMMPLAIGLSSGILPDTKNTVKGVLLSLGVFTILLLVTKLEGLVCVLMALPFVLLAIGIGWLIGKVVQKIRGNQEPGLKMTLSPILLFFMANFFELFSGNVMIPASVSTVVEIDGTPTEVYQSIIAVDTVDVETNWLNKIGLPTPRKCELTEEKVGGLRVCTFEEGVIIETIKEFKKDTFLRMDVTSCDLGKERTWLEFNEDIYSIKPLENGRTSITRTTTYQSNLKPRKYWEFMEALTIKSEQDFVFRNLIKDVHNKQHNEAQPN